MIVAFVGDVMKTKHMERPTGPIFLAFIVIVSGAVAGETQPAVKEHIEVVTTGAHTYKIEMGGTLDEFNTVGYFDTYLGFKRIESKFQPNKYLIIENIGDTDVVNPRIVVNGRRSWFSADDILAGILKPGMTDAEKAMAIYRFTSSYNVQCHENDRRVGPPFTNDESNPSQNTFKERGNPVKAANSYYCSGCSLSAANLVILARRVGLLARATWLNPPDKYGAHCVAELWYDNAWHLFDPEEQSFYLEPDNTTIASFKTVHDNPHLADRTIEGGFAATETEVKRRGSGYKQIYPPHIMPVEQWLSTMAMTLRPGEKFIRRWDHIGKYRCGYNPRNIKPQRPEGLLPYQLANGKFIYQPRLDGTAFRRGIVTELNIVSVGSGTENAKLHPEAVEWPGSVIYKVSSPYPIVGGVVGGKFFRKTADDTCRIYISVHDSDWLEVFSAKDTGQLEGRVAIDDALNPKPTAAIYDYYVKFELHARQSPSDVTINGIYIETDVQMAATSLPSLSAGANKVVYRDQSKQGRRVRITHGWTENSDTTPPIPPAGPVSPADGSRVKLESLKQLVWQPAKDIDGSIADYHIQVSSHPDMLLPVSPNFDRITFSSQPQWQIPAGWLVKGRTYYWRVRAKDNWGAWSSFSNIWRFKIDE